ncbi:MAG TPA: nuclear transport factor 2 family protein [Vicinamibacterales bacterium]|nr:nuclear transport factor 2 family protein [Vicinamibacterales bacterium]
MSDTTQPVIDLINSLFIATDEHDWDTVRRCLAPHVRFDMTSLTGGQPSTLTRDQIVAGWEEGLRPIRATHHQAGNYRVRVNGEQAEAFCYGIAYHLLPEGAPARVRTFVGSYDFALERHGGAWQITSFRFICKFVDPPL